MNLSDYIAAASFIVSFFVAVKTIWTDKKQKKIQKRLNSQQEQINRLTSQRYKEEGNKDDTDVRISIDKGNKNHDCKNDQL